MDILIESTTDFEKDIRGLTEAEKENVIQEINQCAASFEMQTNTTQQKLRRLRPLLQLADCTISSLYALTVSPQLSLVLTVDDDPIFQQTILTLFRVVNRGELENAYKTVAESLYQYATDDTATDMAA